MHTLEEKIEQGQLELENGNFREAHTLLTQVINENPEKWRAWRGIGFANIELKNFDEAVAAFGKATLIRPDDVMSQYGNGLAFQLINDHAKAIKSFEEALRHDHKHGDSKVAISKSLLAQVDHMRNIGNLLAVEEYLEKAHKFAPDNQEVTIQLFRYYEQTGQSTKLETAITDLKRHDLPVPDRADYQPLDKSDDLSDLPTTLPELRDYVAKHHEKWQAWRAIGTLELENKNAQGAHDAFKTATVMRPDDPESQYGFGRALQHLGDHSHAIHAFEEAIRHKKQYPEAKKALTQSLMAYVDHMREIGNLLAVEQYLERAHKNDISDETVTAQLLGYYDETGQGGKKHTVIKDLTLHGLPVPEPVQAGTIAAMPTDQKGSDSTIDNLNSSEELETHLDLHGEDWRNWRKLGFAYLEENRPYDAAMAFKKATVIRFDDADSQYGFGLSHQKMGDHSHAIHPFEEALRQDPKHEKARAALKESLLAYCSNMREIGNLLAIEQFLEKAYKCDPTDKGVGEQLFNYYRETGQGGKAAKIAQDIGIVGADNPSVAPQESNLGDDLLLPQEKQYQPEVPREQPAVLKDISAPTPQAGYGGQQPGQPAGTVYAGAAQPVPTMLPCPACKQLMPSRSRLCPHCGKMVEPITGAILSGKADQLGTSSAEKVYRAVSVLRIIYGLVMVGGGLMIGPVGVILMVFGAWTILSGVGLLFEVDWIQMVVYWGSLLGACRDCLGIFTGFMFNDIVGAVISIFSLLVNGATMWSISKLSDAGA